MKKSIYFLFTAMLIVLAVSCGSNDKNTKRNKAEDTLKTVKVDSVKINQELTDIAKIFAGMKIEQGSPLFSVSQESAYLSYQKSMDSSFYRMERKRLTRINEWKNTEISDINKDVHTIFYPFSGPDFLHVNTFFPNAKKYIMFGLEPVGDVTDIKSIPKEKLNSFFNELNNSIADVLDLSFFKTVDMNKEFNSTYLKGSLPVVLLFIARTGHDIIDVKPFELDANGNVVYLKVFKNLKGEASYNHGAEISFIDKGKSDIKTLQYFSLNVIDGAIQKNSNSRNYLEKIDSNVVTMLKSASYLMHNTYFSIIRNLIFNKSKAILQDDSGIAYRYIDKKKWSIQLYGTYTIPIKMFANRLEEDLKKAYAEGNVKKVPFQYGYGNSTALMLLKRK